jgi:hypothetical protein
LGHLWFQKFQPVTVTGIVSLIALPPTFLGIFLGTQLPGANLPITLLGTIGIYVASLVTSVVIYRLSPLHPLANYPGPVLCKISRFWAWYIADRGAYLAPNILGYWHSSLSQVTSTTTMTNCTKSTALLFALVDDLTFFKILKLLLIWFQAPTTCIFVM